MATTLYASIQQINDELAAASKQLRDSKADPKAKAPSLKKLSALSDKREELYREVAKQFLAVYFDPSLVRNGETVLMALYRLTGGSERYRRELCGPIMDALLEFEIGFTDGGDIVLMRDESIVWACKALGFVSEVLPGWLATPTPTGQLVLTKGDFHG
jgi:hypothetical protein